MASYGPSARRVGSNAWRRSVANCAVFALHVLPVGWRILGLNSLYSILDYFETSFTCDYRISEKRLSTITGLVNSREVKYFIMTGDVYRWSTGPLKNP